MNLKQVFDIFWHKDMKKKFNHIIKSASAKKLLLAILILLLLFFVCNNILLPWYVNKGGVVTIPKLVGLQNEEAIKLLDSLGLEPRDGGSRSDVRYPIGVVVFQNPAENGIVKKGRRVYLTLSGGEQEVVVPNLKGKSLRDAKFTLDRSGLKLAETEYLPSDEFPENTVVDQSIQMGATVKKNSFVSIIVSQGKIIDKVEVPNLVGKSYNEAEKILGEFGLKLGQIEYQPSSNLLPNTIIEQYPRPGELVSWGEMINLFVTKTGSKKIERFEY